MRIPSEKAALEPHASGVAQRAVWLEEGCGMSLRYRKTIQEWAMNEAE